MLNFFTFQSPKNPYSHLTVKERIAPSFPTKQLLSSKKIQGRVLDFGCGNNVDVEFLKSKGFDVTGYDPYYAPTLPSDKFDTILCHYVLNVLLPEEQVYVLMAVSELLKPGGKAYFSVRRDIKQNGFRTHKIHNVKVFQCNVILPYKSLVKTKYCEIYEYKHFNQLKMSSNHECHFCNPSFERELITETATVYAIFDKYPVSNGHALIIPKQHIPNYFNLPEKTKTACWIVVDRVQYLISQKFHPDGFNVGINIGEAAGQTINHVHIHVIPRYQGDVENPIGGVRNVIAGKGHYPIS